MSDEIKIKKSKLYTRTGDKGKTSLLDGKRHNKDELIFDALGDLDECNSSIGIACVYIKDINIDLYNNLLQIQSWLIDLGAIIANPIKDQEIPKDLENSIKLIENWIDLYDNQLPELKSFLLPVFLFL